MALDTDSSVKKRNFKFASKPMWLAGAVCVTLFSFGLGRWTAPETAHSTPLDLGALHSSENANSQNPFLIQETPDNDPRELLPMPGNPGQQGQGGGEGECPIYLYQDGQLFQFAPGQPGFPGGGGDQELFPLVPPSGPRTPSPPTFDGGDDVVTIPKTLVSFQTP